jgi:flavin-dependent dehydrogenase
VDVAVIGGGPAGAAAAIALARSARETVLFDRSRSFSLQAGETLRPEICVPLQELGVWDAFLASRPESTHGIWSVWSGERVLYQDLISNPYGSAWRVDRRSFDRMLLAAAVRAGAHVEAGCASVRVYEDSGKWRISARRGLDTFSVSSRFVVDATGRAATIARSFGIRWKPSDQLLALIAIMKPATSVNADDILLVESTARGWWYSSVLPGGDLVAAFLTDSDLLPAGRSPADSWREAISASDLTASRAAGFQMSNFFVKSAASGCLDRAAGPGWISAGDASSAVDPLSGAGVGKSLRGGLQAALAVDQAISGDVSALDRYTEDVRREFELFQRTGSAYYRAERRWRESPFWVRRSN